jgi:hypothetical protein
LKTVAEWVQTQEDAMLLKSWGIDFLQGAIYGDAVSDPHWPLEPTADGEPVPANMAHCDTGPENAPELDLDPTAAPPEADAPDFSRLRMALSVLDRQFGGSGAMIAKAAAV